MSMFQYFAALEGFVAANSADDDSLTAREADELWDFIKDS